MTSERDRDVRWTEHFSEVPNRLEPDLPLDIPPAQDDLDGRVDPPTRREIRNVIKALKNNKALGQDAIPAELLKINPKLASDVLQSLFIDIWEKEELPREWTQGNIVQIPKKGIWQIATTGGRYITLDTQQGILQGGHDVHNGSSG